MFFKAKSTGDEKALKPRQVVKELSQNKSIKWKQDAQGEIEDKLLDEVGGGINPQPLPPRGDDFRRSTRGLFEGRINHV